MDLLMVAVVGAGAGWLCWLLACPGGVAVPVPVRVERDGRRSRRG